MHLTAMAWPILLAISPAVSHDAAGDSKVAERSITEIRRELRETLVQEAEAAKSSTARLQAIGHLLSLHGEIVRHSSYAGGNALRAARGLLRSRLLRVAREIEVIAGRDEPLLKGKDDVGQVTMPATIVLAQQVPAAGGLPNPGAGNGGPALGSGGPSFGALPDFGPELADLIRRVIHPDSWDTTGGTGTVVYFRPQSVLVVRATLEVHERLTQLLWDLRAAGGP